MTDAKPFHNPFAALRGLPGVPAPEPNPVQPTPDAPDADRRGPARAVVRIERAGRGGKEVTVVEHLDLPAAERAEWLRALKTSLGVGGVLEGDAFVVQGDQRDRVSTWLSGRGVRRVTVAR